MNKKLPQGYAYGSFFVVLRITGAYSGFGYTLRCPLGAFLSPEKLFALIAAATENKHDCKDNYPGAVVVEKVAKAIVVHRYVPPWSSFGRCARLVTYYESEKIW